MTGTVLDERLRGARQVADALLYEGYVLYPYRASAQKNQFRWQFGIVAPAGSADPAAVRTELVVDGRAHAHLHVRVRGLQVQTRTVQDAAAGFEPVAALDTGDEVWTTFDEAVEHEVDVTDLSVEELADGGDRTLAVAWDGGQEEEDIRDPAGAVVGRIVRRRWPVNARVVVSAQRCEGPYPLATVAVSIENTTEPTGSDRDGAIRQSMVAVHTLAAVDGGRFLSTLDPPRFAAPVVAGCRNIGTYPVLIEDDVILSSPIILYDRPAVAPESSGDMCDACEIDEILALRVLTLTDEEKREARGTDPRSAAILDRIEAMSADAFEALHGTFRSFADEHQEAPWWEPAVDAAFDPWSDTTPVGDVEVGKGTRVRLRPSRRADAQDLFVAGRSATVAGVFHDVDDDVHLAVVLDDDPGGDLHEAHGRYRYFRPDEVEVVSG